MFREKHADVPKKTLGDFGRKYTIYFNEENTVKKELHSPPWYGNDNIHISAGKKTIKDLVSAFLHTHLSYAILTVYQYVADNEDYTGHIRYNDLPDVV